MARKPKPLRASAATLAAAAVILAVGSARGEPPADPDWSRLEEELFGSPPAAPEPSRSGDDSASTDREGSKEEAPRPAEETESREAFEESLFGGQDEAPEREEQAPEAEQSTEAAGAAGPMGRAEPSDLLGDLRDTLAAASERLVIGGVLFLRLEYRALSEGPAESFALVSPTTLDLYLDARPVDRVRAYARARVAHDFTVVDGGQGLSATELADPSQAADLGALVQGAGRPRTDVFLDQLWLKFDAAQRVFFTFGQQRIRWGAGRIWNPTDFLNPLRFDPLALFDPRLGVGLFKVHVPFESLGANLYAIANFDGADRLERVGGALRGEIAFETTEISMSGALRESEPLRLGADISTGIGPFELRGELALLYDVSAPTFSGRWSEDDPTDLDELEVTYRDDDVIPQLVLGADLTLEYGDQDQLILGLEYFFNDLGYSGSELYPILLLAPTIAGFEGGPDLLGLREPPPLLFQPLYLGRHYLAVFALLPAPLDLQDHTFTLTAISNLSDRSAVARLDHSVRLFQFLTLQSYVNVHLGQRGEFRLGFDLAPVPGVLPAVPVVPPLFELGFALVSTL